MTPHVIVIKNGVVYSAMPYDNGEDAEKAFVKEAELLVSDWNSYTKEEINDILSDGYVMEAGNSSVCLTWIEGLEL